MADTGPAIAWTSRGSRKPSCPAGARRTPASCFAYPAQARTLAAIAESRGEAFYRGELAREDRGGEPRARRRDDGGGPGGAQPDWVEPIGQDYRGVRLHEIPPNGQGIAALMALGILEHFDLAQHACRLGRQHAPADRGDEARVRRRCTATSPTRRSMQVAPADLLDPDYLAQRAALIDRTRAQDFGHGVPPGSGTVYLTAADASGMMVSYIQSNYNGLRLRRGRARTPASACRTAASASVWSRAIRTRLAPGKRPFHTIIPAFRHAGWQAAHELRRDGRRHAAAGPRADDGAARRLRQNPQAAADGPRWKVFKGRQIALEHAVPASVAAELARRGHQVRQTERWNMEFGARS